MLGSECIITFLKENKIGRIYTFPGGTIAPLYDAGQKAGVDIVCACHEQGAGYAALAEARLTNSPQVVMVTSGPGVTNVMTVVADAFYDSTPLLVFTGQVGTGDLTSGRKVRQTGFQQVDTSVLMSSICKKTYLPMSPDELPRILAAAFELAVRGRPGPVVIDLPMDVQRSPLTAHSGENNRDTILKDEPVIDSTAIDRAAEMICQSERPVVFAGQGVLISRAQESLRKLAQMIGAPVVTSLLGIGAYPTDDPLNLGFLGHTGNQCAGKAVYESDLLIVVGARLDVRQTGTKVNDFIPQGRIIRIDVDADELRFPRVPAEVDICCDAAAALEKLQTSLAQKPLKDYTRWRSRTATMKKEHPLAFAAGVEKPKPQEIIQTINRLTKNRNAVVVTGVGSHQQWTARHFDFDFPNRILLTSGGHGAMGYDLPSAIGAQISRPSDLVLCIVGDGSLQINIQELQTAVNYHLPVKIIVLDNQRLAMVSQFQLLTWGKDPTTSQKQNPDFAKVARAYGLHAVVIDGISNMEEKLSQAIDFKGPVLVHCLVDSHEDVVPMLLADQTIDNMWKNE